MTKTVLTDGTDESLPLVAINEAPRQKTRIQRFLDKLTSTFRANPSVWTTDKIGELTTFLAMVPQGFLGALLADKFFLAFIKEPDGGEQIARALLDTLAFIVSEEGKRRLVRFFNSENFKNFGRKEFWKTILNWRNWSFRDAVWFFINSGFSVVAAGTFAYIATISFNGIATLLDGYERSFTDKVATSARSVGMQVPFALASFLCNLPGFYGIQNGALSLGQRALNSAVRSREFKAAQADLMGDMQAVREEISRCYKSHDDNDLKTMLQRLGLFISLEDLTADNLQEALNRIKNLTPGQIASANYNEEGSVINPVLTQSQKEFIATHLVGVSGAAVASIGMYNFNSIAQQMAANWFGSSNDGSRVIGVMDYISMIALSMSVYGAALSLTPKIFGRERGLNALSTAVGIWVFALTTLVALTGGMPNLYQAFIEQATDQLWLLIMAFAGSALIEWPGFFARTSQGYESSAASKDPKTAFLLALDQHIAGQINAVPGMTPANLMKELNQVPGKEAMRVPQEYISPVKFVLDAPQRMMAACRGNRAGYQEIPGLAHDPENPRNAGSFVPGKIQ